MKIGIETPEKLTNTDLEAIISTWNMKNLEKLLYDPRGGGGWILPPSPEWNLYVCGQQKRIVP